MIKRLFDTARAACWDIHAIRASLDRHVTRQEAAWDAIRENQGRLWAELQRGKGSHDLQDFEFSVFSQWGEDGIIQRLTDLVRIEHTTFIEFGVEDFRESNCRFLLLARNWSGFVIDGSEEKLARLRSAGYYWRHEIEALSAFVTRENIEDLLARSGFAQDLGLLSVDIDGVDYHVLEAIRFYRPRILVVEYNAVFGPTRKITVPYDPAFLRQDKHYSHLYFGASLGAMVHLATSKGYTFVGTNSNGVNAFFVRNDLVTPELTAMAARARYTPSRFRDSRNPAGHLSYLAGDARERLIRGLPVVNVETGAAEVV